MARGAQDNCPRGRGALFTLVFSVLVAMLPFAVLVLIRGMFVFLVLTTVFVFFPLVFTTAAAVMFGAFFCLFAISYGLLLG